MLRPLLVSIVVLVLSGLHLTAQQFPMPWLAGECKTPYAPYGSSARDILDTLTYRGAFDVTFTVDQGDTTVLARLGPRTKVWFTTKASTGLERIRVDMEFIQEREANKQHDIALYELRMWYTRQLRFKMYDEEHVQKCGAYIYAIRATTGVKHDLPKTFRLVFERRSP